MADLDSDDLQSRYLPEARLEGQAAAKRSKYEVEQLVASPGSLPKPVFPDARREASARSGRPTATSAMLARVPREFLESCTPEAQALRRRLLRGATVVFASAGYPGKRFVFELAAALGIKSVIIDHPDSWSRGLVEEGIIAKFLPVDMSQTSDEVFQQSCSLIQQLGSDGLTGSVDGVTTFVELAVPLAARLCERFGLPGMTPASVDTARDKHRTRAAMAKAKLPTPRNLLIRSETELLAAGKFVGFPAVLKPISGAASLGVKKVESMDELRTCYREVVRDLAALVVSSGALTRDDGSGGITASRMIDLSVLLEQYLDGEEVDVDIVFSDGDWRYAAVTDNGPTFEPYFNETWGLMPSLLTKDKQSSLKELAIASVKALGFTSGVFHVECKYSSTGPQLIEVNARMGGGPVRDVNRLVWGVDLVEEAIICALGIPSRPVVPEKPITCIAYYFINAQRSGRVVSTASIEALRQEPGVLAAESFVKPGDVLVGRRDGLATWLGSLVVSADCSDNALAHLLRLEGELVVEISD